MSVQDTSLEAYYMYEKIGKMQSKVLDVIINYGPVTNKEIANIMNKPINTITPRVKELREKGLVYRRGHKVVEGRRSITWDNVYEKELF